MSAYATESRLYDATESQVFDALCAIVCAPWARLRIVEGRDDWLLMNDYLLLMKKNGEKFGGMGNNTYLCSVNTIK